MKGISVVVPVFNEEGNVEALFSEIKSVCEENHYQYEIIFVDDGSSDGTAEKARALSPLKYIRLRKNFGQTAAMDAGIKHAQYDYIVTMDGDRQNDPHDIPRLVAYLEENNLDVVSGWRKNRKDTLGKKIFSRTANFLRGMIVKDSIHDSGCSLKIYKRECFRTINLYGEMHRFIPAYLKIRGFSVGEIVVNHRQRTSGKSKYNWKRAFKGFEDMISVWFWNKFAVRPLHLMGTLGIGTLFIGFIFAVWSVVLYILRGKVANLLQPLLCVFFVITGLQLFISGLLADILSKIYYGSKIGESYDIKEIVETGKQDKKEESH